MCLNNIIKNETTLKFILILLLLTGCFVSCNTAIQNDLSTERIINEGLIATLTINDSIVSSEKELIVLACLTNKSSKDIVLEKNYVLKNPILSLLFLNEIGDTLNTIPPVTPYNDTNLQFKKTLKPDEKYNIEFKHLSLFSPSLPKGKYRVVMKSIASNAAWFKIE